MEENVPPVTLASMLESLTTLRRYCAERGLDVLQPLEIVEKAVATSYISRQSKITDFFAISTKNDHLVLF